MTRREATALARRYPTALVFECIAPWMAGNPLGPQIGDIATLSLVFDTFLCVELVDPGTRDRGATEEGWTMYRSELRPLNAASRRVLAMVSK